MWENTLILERRHQFRSGNQNEGFQFDSGQSLRKPYVQGSGEWKFLLNMSTQCCRGVGCLWGRAGFWCLDLAQVEGVQGLPRWRASATAHCPANQLALNKWQDRFCMIVIWAADLREEEIVLLCQVSCLASLLMKHSYGSFILQAWFYFCTLWATSCHVHIVFCLLLT